jgi:hypothetical protein
MKWRVKPASTAQVPREILFDGRRMHSHCAHPPQASGGSRDRPQRRRLSTRGRPGSAGKWFEHGAPAKSGNTALEICFMKVTARPRDGDWMGG